MKRLVMTCFISTVILSVGGCVNDKARDTESAKHVTKRNPAVIDRMGRAEITNFIIRVPGQKTGYNRADAFALSASQKEVYKSLFHPGIVFWDSLDGNEDWRPPDHQADLAEMLVNDYLVVDTSKVCSVDDNTYLEIERTPLGANTTCGGRTPNDDVIDTTMSLLIAGPQAGNSVYIDGVDGVPRPATDEFPYLAAPYATHSE